MPEDGKAETQGAKALFRTSRFSRREFLERVGISLGGTALASLVLSPSCSAPSSTGTLTGTAPSATNETEASPPVSSSAVTPTPVFTSTNPPSGPASTAATMPTKPTISPSATARFSYIPPTELPPLIQVPDSTCTIAADRLYSLEHIWVKTVASDLVVLGVTPSMVAILYEPYGLTLPEAGQALTRDSVFGDIVGYKTSADLISPASGTVEQVNDYLVRQGKQGEGGYIAAINTDPYNSGWMVVVRLSKPGELHDLLTPEGYRERLGKG